MTGLQASPLSLVRGALVVARLRATNAVGSSPFSDDSVIAGKTYADVRTVPITPTAGPSRGPGTTTTSIEAVIVAMTGADSGGSAILSYNIEYADASSGPWIELQGLTTNSLSLSVTKAGLTAARAYYFRFQARNAFGWSPSYSPVSAIYTTTEPGQVNAPQVLMTLVATNVQLTWRPPSTNGSPILAYEILFAVSAASDATFVTLLAYCDGS